MPIFIAVGSNMPSLIGGVNRTPAQSLQYAATLFEQRGIVVAQKSGLWESPSWPPGQGHPDFLNGVWRVETSQSPHDLLSILKDIEHQVGRKPSQRNAPRPLDLDIIDYNSRIMQSVDLSLPHPRMTDRAFVLFPLAQIAPQWVNPESGQGVWEAIARLPSDDGLSCNLRSSI